MTKLIELEKKLLAQGQIYTTFKQCSLNDEDASREVFVSENETVNVFNLDEIKESLLKPRFSVPMSVDAMWIDHDNNILHLIEFKDVPNLRGNKKKEIRLKFLDTALFLVNDFNIATLSEANVVFVLVRTLSVKELPAYHVKSRAKEYTPAYLEYIQELAGIRVLEIKREDFDRYIENSADFFND